ncbi:hypothetical protein HHI36_014999 [Cryptolaemus montrouzieri]|uniref:Uncharacterized protein n=1 Tax=Cryptolaemus montrouzieri TaxID=559131 RepID=A0ABD2N4E2_9CUCU
MNFWLFHLLLFFLHIITITSIRNRTNLTTIRPVLTTTEDDFQPVSVDYITFDSFTDVWDMNIPPKVRGITIKNSNLTIAFLKNLPIVKQLALVNNNIENFQLVKLNFDFMPKLEIFNISRQNINPMANNSFIRFKNLKQLSLICTSLTVIESKAFNTLDKLEILDLSGNFLKVVSEELLAPLENLKILILNNNLIKKFMSIPKLNCLEKLYLENNPIDSLANVDRIALKRKANKLKNIKFCTRISIACQSFESIC